MVDFFILQHHNNIVTVWGYKATVELEWDYAIWINTRYYPFKMVIDSDVLQGTTSKNGMVATVNEPTYLPKNWTI